MHEYSHAIVLLPAGIKQSQSGKWVSTDLSEADDKLGAPGGKLRVLAAALLLKDYCDSFIITGGGKGGDVPKGAPKKRPLLAEILRDELIAEGVSLDRIKLEWSSNSTYQELVEVERMTKEFGVKALTFITSQYSLSRLKLMVKIRFASLGDQCVVEFVTAEDVLVKNNSGAWKRKIEEAYQGEYMKKRLARELCGVGQLRAGTYKFC